MSIYSRGDFYPPISIDELSEDNLSCLASSLSWEQRIEVKKIHPEFQPREFLIGRVALSSENVVARIMQQRLLAETEGVIGTRKDLMEAILQHTSETGPAHPLFSGRGGNMPLRGEPMRIPDDERLWGTSPWLFRETLAVRMNNPFNYIKYRHQNFDASEYEGEPFVPLIAVFDQDLLVETEGNIIDETSWKMKHGSPLGAVASTYYFNPNHFTLDKYRD